MFALLMVAATTARADVELTGIIVEAEGSQFILSDPTKGATSDWLKIGQSFEGYVILSFDNQTDVIDIKGDGAVIHLRLRDSKVASAPVDSSAENEQARHKRIIEMYGSLGELILADVRIDSSFAYITPREVWKGNEFVADQTVSIPRPNRFGAGTWVMALKSGVPLGTGPSMAAGTDGVHTMGGIVPLDEIRAYYNSASDSAAPVSKQ